MSADEFIRVEEIASPEARSIAIGPFGSSMKSDVYTDQGVPVVRGKDIFTGRGLRFADPVYVSSEFANSFPAWIAKRDDLVFPHRGAIGRVGIVDVDQVMLSTSMMKLSVDRERFDPTFVHYFFRGHGRHQLLANASTVGTPGIAQPLATLKSVEIPKLDLSVQKAIAEVLGALDDKIAANERAAISSQEFAALSYRKVARLAPRVPMTEVLTPLLGGTPKRSDESLWDGVVPWVSAKDIAGAEAGFVFRTEEGISQEATRANRLRPLKAGSVVLTARGTVGAVARLSMPASINQSCYGFEPGAVAEEILYFLIKDVAKSVESLVHGSVFDTITKKTFDNVDVPDPSTDEMSDLESALAPFVLSCEGYLTENDRLSRTRDDLLPLLISGKITVKDAEKAVSDAV